MLSIANCYTLYQDFFFMVYKSEKEHSARCSCSCKYTHSKRLGRVLVSDFPGQQDGVLHGSLYSEVGGKN